MSDDHRRLTKDLRDLRVYLQSRFPDAASIPLYVERHYGAQPFEIACVVIGLPDRALRRQVRARAEAALRHLGYRVENRGCDVYDVWPRQTEMSAHDHLRALHGSEGWRAKRRGSRRGWQRRRWWAGLRWDDRMLTAHQEIDLRRRWAPGWGSFARPLLRGRQPRRVPDYRLGARGKRGDPSPRLAHPVTDRPGPCRFERYLREPLAM
jgi:hypothetical protein